MRMVRRGASRPLYGTNPKLAPPCDNGRAPMTPAWRIDMDFGHHDPSANSMRRGGLSAFELAELHKLKMWRGAGPSVDQAAMERLCERGYVHRTLGRWTATHLGLFALSRR